jgi:hypothetical protein
MKRAIPVIATILLVGILVASRGNSQQAAAPAASDFKAQLYDPTTEGAAALENVPQFAWEMFMLANWPVLPGKRGLPDSKRTIGVPVPTVWESFKNVSEIYKPKGARPATWEIIDELPPNSPPPPALPVDSKWVHFLAEPIMIDGQQICDGGSQVIQYDVRSNQSYFDYVVNNLQGKQLYTIEGQLAALADPNFTFSFPGGTLEVKASWRILGPSDDPSRFWTAYGVYWDHKHVLRSARIGLTGLHITSRVVPNWIWMTFEQVDNPTATYKYFLRKKGSPVGDNPTYDPSLDAINAKFQQGFQKMGVKWQYYKLERVQTEFVDNAGKPTIMSNTQIETYFQDKSSCITCHALASIGKPMNSKQSLRLNFFYPHNPYVGTIDFQKVANQQFPGEKFKPMDFVWSLRNAKYVNIVKKEAAGPAGHKDETGQEKER